MLIGKLNLLSNPLDFPMAPSLCSRTQWQCLSLKKQNLKKQTTWRSCVCLLIICKLNQARVGRFIFTKNRLILSRLLTHLAPGFFFYHLSSTLDIKCSTTYDNALLNQHVCALKMCSVFLSTHSLCVFQTREGWGSRYCFSCFEYLIQSSQIINNFNIL